MKAWFENYQEAIDPEADNYSAEIEEFLSSNGLNGENLVAVYIPDGDRDGYTMVAEVVFPDDMNPPEGFVMECPCDPEEYNYL